MKHNPNVKALFISHLGNQQLKKTKQREIILNAFLKREQHITAEELYLQLKPKHPSIGYSTVYRTLKLLTDAGLAREISFSDGITRFEHHYAHPHHDHLICLSCGKSVEFVNSDIESLQELIVREHEFQAENHKLEIYGYCKQCQISTKSKKTVNVKTQKPKKLSSRG
ncbi:MAG: transcriptional repressor [bacterium]|nr:transcriptional repressor [bacterium]